MTVQFTTAENIALEQIHNAMLDAFSDYDLPLQPDFEQFERMLRSRHFDAKLSSLAVENEKVLSFWIIGKRGNKGHLAMSGTRVHSRGNGLAKLLSANSEAAMRDAGVANFQFEVLTTNERAIRLYEKLGHAPKREYDVFRFAAPTTPSDDNLEISLVNWNDIAADAQSFKDVEPSWQADNAAIEALGTDVIVLGAKGKETLKGYLATAPNGSILQLAVTPNYRRKGVATALLSQFARTNQIEQFTYINIDSNDLNTQQLMRALNADVIARQLEMHKSL